MDPAMLFKNKAVQLTYVGKPKKNEDSAPIQDEVLNPETVKLVEETGKRVVKYLALTVVAVVVAITAANTLSEIAVKKTKSADNE